MSAPGRRWLRGPTDYLRYRAARVISMLGSQLSLIAFPLLVLALGGHAVQAGALSSCSLFVGLASRLPGGHLADRFDRLRLMLVTDAIRLAALASIPLVALAGRPSYPQLLIVAMIDSAATAVFGPAATAFIRDMVSSDRLTRALAQTQASKAAVTILGPAAGGVLFELNRMLPFTLDAVSYGVSGLLLIGISVRSRAAASADRRLTAGMRWLWHRRMVLRILLFFAVINLVSAAAEVLVVVALREHGVPSSAIGAALAISGGGAVVGAMLARQVMARLDAMRLCALVGVIWAAGFASLTVSFTAWVVGGVLAVLFFFLPACGIALFQLTVGEAPHDLLGRVTTAATMLSSGLAVVGPLLAGACLQAFGLTPTCLVLAGCCLLATAVTVAPPALAGWQPDQPPAEPAEPAEPAGAAGPAAGAGAAEAAAPSPDSEPVP